MADDPTLEPDDRPHVVMLVMNDVTGDSRVQKSAAVVSEAGYRVTVVGRSMSEERTEEWIEDVRIIRVPVELTLKAHVRAIRTLGTQEVADRDSHARQSVRYGIRARRRTLSIKGVRARITGRPKPVRTLGWAQIWLLRRQLRGDRRRVIEHRRLAGRAAKGRSGAEQAPVRWRDEIPVISDFELAYLPVVEELEPDLIHAHDHSVLAIAEHATLFLRAAGRPVKLLYDAHEYVRGVPHDDERVLRAWSQLEHEHIGTADAVITVSPIISERLRDEHSLPRTPDLVLNAPVYEAFDPESELSVRAAAGVPEGVPLLVYSGGVKKQRGVGTLVEALPLMEGVHAAVVARAESQPVQDLRETAEALGCSDRLHIVGFVPADSVSSYLRTADVGIHTIWRSGNADVALPNKMFEYFHAGLPMVVSDVTAMAEFTRRHKTGEVFRAQDPRSLANACLKVLGDRERYRSALSDEAFLRRYSWEKQARTLIAVYNRLLPAGDARAAVHSGRSAVAP